MDGINGAGEIGDGRVPGHGPGTARSAALAGAAGRISGASVRERITRAADRLASRRVRLMEVCGTHTMAIFRHGIRGLLPDCVRLISGPGCPVCVTDDSYIDAAVSLGLDGKVTLATFGDMMRVPGSRGSLQDARSRGADVHVVYSCADALDMAAKAPSRQVVFLAVGFETTAPTIAATVIRARNDGIRNFSILAAHKLIPPAMAAVLDGGTALDGFIAPGHVSVVIGSDAYLPLAAKYRVPIVVTGFEADDILEGVAMLLEQIADGRAAVENQYVRVVRPGGNPAARRAMEEVFEPSDASWRGLGVIPDSGLRLRREFTDFDAGRRFGVAMAPAPPPKGCRCGDVLKGAIDPPECPMFGKSCDPARPKGPCMVSSEGSCAAHYRYGRVKPGSGS
ncbi:MAG: hydrogenase formation protein HypD [Planctomycetota bacterium]|nr:hydrogenase formation protein HypD [Planctomycetota bacterium]